MAVTRADPKYVAVLATACIVILVIGAALRPGPGSGDAASAGVTTDMLGFERITQRREVEVIADYFSHVASQVESSVVLLTATGQSGVIWQAGEVVTSARLGPFPGSEFTALGSQEAELPTTAAAPQLPYVLLSAPLDASVSSRTQVGLYRPGSWLLAVWRSRTGGLRYEPGNLFGVMERRCGGFALDEVHTNFEFDPAHAGAGVFSLDGSLIAVVLDCDGRLIAAEAGALEARARAKHAPGEQLIARFGMRVRDASEAEQAFFGRGSGAIVGEIWWGYRAHEAGLLPGDWIIELDGVPVQAAADLQALLLPVALEVHELRVWRAGRRRSVRLVARAASEAAVSFHGFVGGQEGLLVESVLPGSVAEDAGAQAGDRIVAVNQRIPESFEDLEDSFARDGGGPLYLTLERRGRVWGALVRADE